MATKTIYGKRGDLAYCDDLPIEMIARWGRNGIKYVWLYPSQKKLDNLIKRYGVDQISTGSINEEGKWRKVNLVWLER